MALFQPGRIGSLDVPNRIVMAPLGRARNQVETRAPQDRAVDYYDLGITTFLIRGFDPFEDVLDYGRNLIPLVRAAVAQRDGARIAAE